MKRLTLALRPRWPQSALLLLALSASATPSVAQLAGTAVGAEACEPAAWPPTTLLSPAEWGDRQLALASEIRRRISAPPGDQPAPRMAPLAIDSIWKQDSSAVEWALADVMGDAWSTSESEAILAGLTYAAYSGRSEPLLMASVINASPARQLIAMRAVHRPISQRAELQVLRIACDAAWLLRTMKSDSTYWLPPLPAWAYRQEDLMFEGYRLMSDERRAAVKPYFSKALGTSGRLDIIESQSTGSERR